MLTACTRLLRGASYLAFDGVPPERAGHAAIAAPYAHVTAPLRRLADRYATEVCLALCAKRDVPDWTRAALPDLPREMDDGARRGHRFAADIVDLVEAGLLRDRVGEVFAGVVVSRRDEEPTKGRVLIRVPAIEATVAGATDLPLGEETEVTLESADPRTRQVRFRSGGPCGVTDPEGP
jgi:exoribonuclease R